MYETVPGLLDRISSALGTDVTDGNGRLDRAKLASEVFSCPEKLNILENMVYPEVKKNFESWRLKKFSDGAPVVAMESALVLEKPFFRDLFDKKRFEMCDRFAYFFGVAADDKLHNAARAFKLNAIDRKIGARNTAVECRLVFMDSIQMFRKIAAFQDGTVSDQGKIGTGI